MQSYSNPKEIARRRDFLLRQIDAVHRKANKLKKKGPRLSRRSQRVKKRRRKLERQFSAIKKQTPSIKIDEKELVASICRESFFEFVKEFWYCVSQEEPVWNWHIEYLCEEIQEAAERVFRSEAKIYDIVVNIPPGTTKSTVISVMLIPWVWTRMIRAKFIGASYSADLARDELSMKSRDVVESEKYKEIFPEIKLREDQNTKSYFQNTHGGWRYSVGVNGSVMGKHAHFIVIDDPIDPNEAVSEAKLKAANRWISETLSSRKVNKATTLTILVMQRLHEDDPSAQFLRKKRIRHIRLPAEVEDGPIPAYLEKYYKDGLLDPIRLSDAVLDEFKANGDGYYAAQFRQMPAPPGGAMFKVDRIKIGPKPSDSEWVQLIRFWDKAGTLGGRGAYTAGVKMGLDKEGRFWILDVVRVRLDTFEREHLIRSLARQDGINCRIGMEQEGGSGGKDSVLDSAKRLAGYKVTIARVGASDGDKELRAEPFSSQVNAGNVYIPEQFHAGQMATGEWLGWAKDYINELKYFPYSKYKDQVDASSGGFNLIAKPRVRIGGLRKPSYDPTMRPGNHFGPKIMLN